MTNEEAKKAFQQRIPIQYDGHTYTRINAIVYKLDTKDNLLISAELLDKNNNCVVVARVKDITEVN